MENGTTDATRWTGLLDLMRIRYLLLVGERLALLQASHTVNQPLRHGKRGGDERWFTAWLVEDDSRLVGEDVPGRDVEPDPGTLAAF